MLGKNEAKRLSPVNKYFIKDVNHDNERADVAAEIEVNIDGLFIADGLVLYRDKFGISPALDGGYTLDNVGEKEECGNKIKYKGTLKDLYLKDWQRFYEYNCVDVLVGSITKINDEIIGNALDDFRIDHPCLSDSVIRGGDICKIPLRRTLARFTAPGYAAVGDSASMIDPLSGSGISHSIEAGAILAKAVDSAAGKELTEDILWQFQYDYFRRFSNNQLSDDAIKLFMLGAGEEKLNAVFDKKIVTAKEFYVGKQTAKDILQKVGGVLSTPSLIPDLITLVSRKMKISSVLKSLPEKYDESAVSFWADAYEAI